MSASLNDRPSKVEVVDESVTVIAGASLSNGLPAGGVANDLLVKSSATNYDAAWSDAPIVDSITLDTTAAETLAAVGQTAWDDTAGSAATLLKGGNVTAIMGQTIYQRVVNETGSTMTKGQVVYLTGASGQKVTVALAQADGDPTSSKTFGVVAETIAHNGQGFVITEGLLQGFATNLLTEGAIVWLSPTTPGGMTTTKPTAPDHTVMVGICVKSGSGTSGSILVKVQNGYELDELHDVAYTGTPATGDVLTRTAGGLWTNAAPAASGIPATIIDAKGDLIVGTAADTAARLAVGTDGYVLAANSGETAGVNWTPAPVGGAIATGNSVSYWGIPGCFMIPANTSVATNGLGAIAFYQPIIVTSTITVTDAQISVVTTAGSTGALARMSCYTSDNACQPVSLVADWGEVSTTSIGDKTISGLSTVLTPGRYLTRVQINSTTTQPTFIVVHAVPSGGGLASNMATLQGITYPRRAIAYAPAESNPSPWNTVSTLGATNNTLAGATRSLMQLRWT